MEHGYSIIFLAHALEHSVRADYQNYIILKTTPSTSPVVARQPHPDPNYAPYAEARRVTA